MDESLLVLSYIVVFLVGMACGYCITFLFVKPIEIDDDAYSAPATASIPTTTHTGECAYRTYVYDCSDGVRREIQLHQHDGLADRHMSEREADKRMKALVPKGVQRRFVAERRDVHGQ